MDSRNFAAAIAVSALLACFNAGVAAQSADRIGET